MGSIGHLGTYSFHETKNVISGEGGALLVNSPELVGMAEIYREKGTDRSSFFRGEVDKYTWQAIGSSYLPGELIAAFLWAQLQEGDRITAERNRGMEAYHKLLEPLESGGISEATDRTGRVLTQLKHVLHPVAARGRPANDPFRNETTRNHRDLSIMFRCILSPAGLALLQDKRQAARDGIGF